MRLQKIGRSEASIAFANPSMKQFLVIDWHVIKPASWIHFRPVDEQIVLFGRALADSLNATVWALIERGRF